MAKILIGISGSIAAFKTILLIRKLTAANHECKIILTRGGEHFVTPQLIAGLGCEVYTDNNLLSTEPKEAMLHINLARAADIFIIAPASANSIAKLAQGFADNLLGEVYLAAKLPIYIAPAMNQAMWSHPALQNNLRILKEHNCTIWEPQDGIQACGENGTGRMQEVEQLLPLIELALQDLPAHKYQNPLNSPSLDSYNLTVKDMLEHAPGQLIGKTIMITLGATVEPLDPVRFLSNHSSGKMGVALINAALSTGAEVIAIYGQITCQLPQHPRLSLVHALSAQEMLANSLKFAVNSDAVIACAAVCDYRPEIISPDKIKKNQDTVQLTLIKNPDIVATIKQQHPHLIVAGFAAETNNIINHATTKLKHKGLDLIIANDVSNNKVFNQDETEISLISHNHHPLRLDRMSKQKAASAIIAKLIQLLNRQEVV